MIKRFLALLMVLLMGFSGLSVHAVSVNSKQYSYVNGNANDATQVDAEFVNLYSNDSTLGTAVTNLESNTMSIGGGKTFTSNILVNGVDERTSANGVYIDQMLIKDGKPNIASAIVNISSIDTSTDIITTSLSHGLSTGAAIQIRAINGGSLPTGVTASTVYYVNVASGTTFTLHTDPAKATAGTPKVDITATGSATQQIIANPASNSEGDIWVNGGLKYYNGGATVTLANSVTGMARPRRYRATEPPVYASTTTYTVASIDDRSSDNTADIYKSTSTTVDVTTTGINGIAQSANLANTVTVTTGTTNVSSGTSLNTLFQVGDVLCTAGGQCRRLTVVGTTTATSESNWTSTETGVTYKRGGRAPNTWYYLYSISDGVTPGLILSTRNVAAGDTLADLPSGYTVSRQQAFANRLDSSSLLIAWIIGEGWPIRPRIHWDLAKSYVSSAPATVAGTANVLAGGTSGTYAAVSCVNFIPPISKLASLHLLISGGAAFHGAIRPTGSSHNGTGWGSGSVSEGYGFLMPTNSSQSIDYIRNNGAGTLYIDVDGFIVTEVN